MDITMTIRIAKSRKEYQCLLCNKTIPKGTPYYRTKAAYKDEDEFISLESIICPRCNYYDNHREARLQTLPKRCQHPQTGTKYRYIPGWDGVMEPDYDYCLVCGKVLV